MDDQGSITAYSDTWVTLRPPARGGMPQSTCVRLDEGLIADRRAVNREDLLAETKIEVLSLDPREFRYERPIVSGTVYETTADGRRPLAHTRVLYSLASAGYDAYTETDE